MKKIILLLLVVTAIGCSKEDKDDGTITQKGLLPAPDWLVGTWVSEYNDSFYIINEKGDVFFKAESMDKKSAFDKDINKIYNNEEIKQYKDDKIFFFLYKYSTNIRDLADLELKEGMVPFVKYEFKKISDNEMRAGIYFSDENGNRLDIPDNQNPLVIYTKTK